MDVNVFINFDLFFFVSRYKIGDVKKKTRLDEQTVISVLRFNCLF